jgi:hypothetical protein
MIALNSAFFSFPGNVIFFFISGPLKKQSADMARFSAITSFPWSIKPVYGWISDSIYPFRYRLKPYVTLMQSIYIATALYIAAFTMNYQGPTVFFNFNTYKWAMFLMNLCVAFIDSMAWGLTVITTKTDMKIELLKKRRATMTGEELMDGDTSMKSVGIYNLLRGMLRTFFSMLGGFVATKIPVGINYLFLTGYPVYMVIYTLFFFKEQRVGFLIKKKELIFREKHGQTVWKRFAKD